MSSTSSSADPAADQKRKHTYGVAVAAFLIPFLIVGQFALVAIVPVTSIVYHSFHNPRLRPLRWWAAGLGAVYISALVRWAIGPDRAPSLSKDINPALAWIISLAGPAVGGRYLVLAWTRRRRPTLL